MNTIFGRDPQKISLERKEMQLLNLLSVGDDQLSLGMQKKQGIFSLSQVTKLTSLQHI